MNFNRYTHKPSERGFTMIELLIVFALMGVLSVYMIGSSFIASRERARDSQRKSDLKMLTIALEEFYNDYGYYPDHNANFEIMACGPNIDTAPIPCPWGSQMGHASSSLYMAELPSESESGMRYVYRSDGQSWQLFAKLERDDDPSAKTGGYTGVNCNSGGAAVLCNYGISSGNITPDDSI